MINWLRRKVFGDKRQEYYDRVKEHLLTQNKKSYNDRRMCLYRHPQDDLKCAIGVLIPDEHYKYWMEGEAIGNFPKPVLSDLGFCGYEDFLRGLQMIHDNYQPVEWKSQLRNFAEHHKLEP